MLLQPIETPLSPLMLEREDPAHDARCFIDGEALLVLALVARLRPSRQLSRQEVEYGAYTPAGAQLAMLDEPDKGVDTRTIQDYLGHKNIVHIVRWIFSL
jgi:hypothetical protein